MSLAFLHWEGIALHPWPFDIALFVLKGDVKLQLTSIDKLFVKQQIELSLFLMNSFGSMLLMCSTDVDIIAARVYFLT